LGYLKQDLPFIGALGLALVTACAAVVYLLTGGTNTLLATAVAIAAAVLGQIVLVALLMRHNEKNEASARRFSRDMAGVHSEFRRKTESMQGKIDLVGQQAQAQTDMIASGFADLKNSYASLQTVIQQQRLEAPAIVVPVVEDEAEMQPSLYDPPEPVAEDSEFTDQILFALEPIVDVQSGRTAHYRMHLSMMLDEQELSHDKLLHYAGRVGKRAELDVLALRESFSLLERLRARDPELNIFVGLGAETLADADAVSKIEADRQALGENAAGLVFEMTHSMLAGLSEAGLEGLARLARAGAHFSLAQVSVSGLDLHAMNTLNVRYIGLAASSIDQEGPSTALIGFAQMARLSRVSVIVTGMSNAALLGKLGSVARLACGPCFAAPRRVKRDLGAANSAMEMAA
jgi:EAL domain-containing protein (putative c-di-GMP-specific phosphodiesterase class I)